MNEGKIGVVYVAGPLTAKSDFQKMLAISAIALKHLY